MKNILSKLMRYHQTLKIKSDLAGDFGEVTLLRKSRERQQTLTDFLS